MRYWRVICLSGTFLLTQNAISQEMPKTSLTVGMYRIEAEVAANPADREKGLMFRRSMPAHEGMLFVFDKAPLSICMWMKNTLLPLSVAFLDKDGKIINIEDMQPETESVHCASKPAFYALEMNLGWFKSKGIAEGRKIEGIAFRN